MTSIDIKDFGISHDEVLDLVVEKISFTIMRDTHIDDNGDGCSRDSSFQAKVKDAVNAKIQEAVDRVASQSVTPTFDDVIKNFTIKETNSYGEKKGKDRTLVEYMVDTANNYLSEDVNSNGKSKREAKDSYNWRSAGSRVMWHVSEYLHDGLRRETEKSMKDLRAKLEGDVAKAVKASVKSVLDKMAK